MLQTSNPQLSEISLSACFVTLLFNSSIIEIWKVAGVLVGVYTGSLPNLASIGLALNVDTDTLILIQGADFLLCGIFSLILLSPLIKKLYSFLSYAESFPKGVHDQNHTSSSLQDIVKTFSLGVLIVAVGAGVSSFVGINYQDLIAIFVISTLSILLSFKKKIRNIPTNYDVGEFFLLIFCISIGSQIDFSKFSLQNLNLIGFTAAVIAGAVFVHMLFCKFFKIDRDTAIITMTAAVYSPAFVPPVADVLENRSIVLSGITAGLAGLALGNYFGVATAYFLRWTLGF